MVQNRDKLRINKNEHNIKSILHNAVKSKAKVLVWMLLGDHKVTAECSLKILREARGELVFAPKKKSEEEFLKIVSGKDYVNFYIPSEKVIFQVKASEVIQGGDLVAKIPEMITQVERRSFLRLFVEDDLDINITFTKVSPGTRSLVQKFEKKCYDLSPGGLSLILSRSEEKFFNTKDQITSAELRIDGKSIFVDLEVMNACRIAPNSNNKLFYSGTKLGLCFSKISQNDRIFIEKLVFDLVDIDDVIVGL